MVSGGLLGILERVTTGEVLILLVFALVILGPERLPDAARSMGRWVAKARSMSSGLTGEIREVLDDPDMQPLREVGEFVASPRRKLMEYAAEAENEAAEARRLAAQAAAAAEAAEAAAASARADAQEATDAAESAEEAAHEAVEALETAESLETEAVETEAAAELLAEEPDARP
ncbi:MAG: hypothetical protein GX868_14115 [Actinobacteria bacterium]|nr:hypothetical protein [Actinomycetota bacterium]